MASVFKQLGQISMVVEDVMETAKIWNDEYGIGPWGFLHFTEENMTSMSVHGKMFHMLWTLHYVICIRILKLN